MKRMTALVIATLFLAGCNAKNITGTESLQNADMADSSNNPVSESDDLQSSQIEEVLTEFEKPHYALGRSRTFVDLIGNQETDVFKACELFGITDPAHNKKFIVPVTNEEEKERFEAFLGITMPEFDFTKQDLILAFGDELESLHYFIVADAETREYVEDRGDVPVFANETLDQKVYFYATNRKFVWIQFPYIIMVRPEIPEESEPIEKAEPL